MSGIAGGGGGNIPARNINERLLGWRLYAVDEMTSNTKHVAANLIGSLKYALRPLPRKFIVYNSDQKIYIESENVGVYPDALVICEEPQFWQGREDLIVNPLFSFLP